MRRPLRLRFRCLRFRLKQVVWPLVCRRWRRWAAGHPESGQFAYLKERIPLRGKVYGPYCWAGSSSHMCSQKYFADTGYGLFNFIAQVEFAQ